MFRPPEEAEASTQSGLFDPGLRVRGSVCLQGNLSESHNVDQMWEDFLVKIIPQLRRFFGRNLRTFSRICHGSGFIALLKARSALRGAGGPPGPRRDGAPRRGGGPPD